MTAAPRRSDAPLRGIILMCAAVLCFVLMNTIVKHLSDTVPVPLIIWGRYFFHLVLILAFFPRRIPTLLTSQRKSLQVLRSVLVLLATLCMFTAVSLMPLADVVSITFVAPLLVTGLSVPILGEHVGLRRWAAVAAGFIGVLIVIRPGAGVFQWAAVLALGQALFYASYQILTRLTSRDADPLSALFYTALVGAVATSFAAPLFWVPLGAVDWLLLALAGLFGGAGHFAVIKAYERADASVIAPFAYTELVWAVALGFAVFGDFPDRWTLVGALIIAGSGLYVLHRERARKDMSARPASGSAGAGPVD
ncbi:MAG: DMT family transporter [Alphaproteobacteria bacterium]|nr:DMT family transporter [Alphaproteobacteria bacterium]